MKRMTAQMTHTNAHTKLIATAAIVACSSLDTQMIYSVVCKRSSNDVFFFKRK